jgi:DNA mismatch repair protein MutL
MGRVQLLPDHVANQIAAGEVVERPASVVKELVENAIDAGATRIEVEIQAGGRNLIRVSDNGCGMSRDDALMSLERHATSKLRLASDLVVLRSFGFRGEALPSIASVSLFSLTTRESGESAGPAGTQVLIDGGKILTVKDAGHPPGTTIEVRQLFFNVPARKKFLRTPETEKAHIQDYLLLVGLSNPQLTLTYIQDHKRVFHLPGLEEGRSIPEKLRTLRTRWNQFPACPEDLVEVYYEGELPISHPNDQRGQDDNESGEGSDDGGGTGRTWLLVWGLIGRPGVSRSTRADQHLFVNRRPVENRTLNTAILEGYHTAIPKGRYPVGCLFLEIDPAEVDVNIHPAKKEIKFHRERAVRQICGEAVREALFEFATGSDREGRKGPAGQPEVSVTSQTSAKTGEHGPSTPSAKSPPPIPRPNLGAIRRAYQQDFLPTEIEEEIERQKSGPAAEKSGVSQSSTQSNQDTPPAVSRKPPAPVKPPGAESGSASRPAGESGSDAQTDESAAPEPTLKVPLKVIGMTGKNFVLMESDRGLVIMDQRAARARVIYEKILADLKKHAVASQRLLLPETFEMSSKDAEVLRENLDSLNAMGVGIREFGERVFVLEALPPVIRTTDARRFAIELIDRIRLGGTGNHTWDFGEESIAREMALQAVQQNPALSESEIHLVIRDLRYCRMPYTSPDGRPTLIEMSFPELDRKFGIRG